MDWRKSSYSYANGNCLEMGELPDGDIGVRDSKDPGGPVLKFTPDEWREFLRAVCAGIASAPPPVAGALISAGRGPDPVPLSRFIQA
jgi:hypothetical protein